MATNEMKQPGGESPGAEALSARLQQREAQRLATEAGQERQGASMEAVLARISAEVTAEAARALRIKHSG